ncbi:MAG: hypothetical protein NTW96_26120 [Planctomycetia bacterium]|nr:hypothetical protein [Planctomycetia bacterium]
MTRSITVESTIHFQRRGRGSRREIASGASPAVPERPLGRVPRISRLMALAIRFEHLIRTGEIADYAELARLGHVSRARITQIINLLLLASDLQERLLFLPRIEGGKERIHLHQLQSITVVPDWRKQRRLWGRLPSSGRDDTVYGGVCDNFHWRDLRGLARIIQNCGNL